MNTSNSGSPNMSLNNNTNKLTVKQTIAVSIVVLAIAAGAISLISLLFGLPIIPGVVGAFCTQLYYLHRDLKNT